MWCTRLTFFQFSSVCMCMTCVHAHAHVLECMPSVRAPVYAHMCRSAHVHVHEPACKETCTASGIRVCTSTRSVMVGACARSAAAFRSASRLPLETLPRLPTFFLAAPLPPSSSSGACTTRSASPPPPPLPPATVVERRVRYSRPCSRRRTRCRQPRRLGAIR